MRHLRLPRAWIGSLVIAALPLACGRSSAPAGVAAVDGSASAASTERTRAVQPPGASAAALGVAGAAGAAFSGLGAGGAEGGASGAVSAPAEVAPASAGAEQHALGERVEAGLYVLKVDGLKVCRPAGAPKADAGRTAPAAPLGVTLSIEAKVKKFSVTPRDLTLESGGMIVRAEFPAAPPLPGCAPSLPIMLSKRGQTARGVAVFKLPPGFAPATGTVTLAYRPTRWGGAEAAEVSLPACLASCPPAAGPAKRARR